MGRKKRVRRAPRWRSCLGKEKMSKQDAIKKAERLRRQVGSNVHAYQCVYKCYTEDGQRSWHVGHR